MVSYKNHLKLAAISWLIAPKSYHNCHLHEQLLIPLKNVGTSHIAHLHLVYTIGYQSHTLNNFSVRVHTELDNEAALDKVSSIYCIGVKPFKFL